MSVNGRRKRRNFMNLKGFQPKLFSSLKNGYDKTKLVQDLLAGVIVGIVALPLAIAFGIASGATPEAGILTAIVAGFIISFLGGSKVQIGGPTGAFIVIVYGIIQEYGMSGLCIATFMAGAFLILMGVLHLGTIIKYIPYPIIVGFTSGIALTIFATQVKDLFGLQIAEVPAGFIDKWITYFKNFDTVSWWSLLVGVGSILIIVFTPKVSRKLPGSLVAIIVMTIVCLILKSVGVEGIETIGDRFSISTDLPQAAVPKLDWNSIRGLAQPAMVIAMLISSTVGTLIPLFFKKIGIDPAVASGPLITTINDLVAVVTYYGISKILLIDLLHLA